MKKQYKHKNGMVVFLHANGLYETEPNSFSFPKNIVENSFDWTEIIRPDYTILSFKQNSSCEDLWVNTPESSNKWWRSGGHTVPYTTEEILKNTLYSIYSVRRESDGEVFTVGDYFRFLHEDDNSSYRASEIYGFCLSDNTICIKVSKEHTHNLYKLCFVRNVTPEKAVMLRADNKQLMAKHLKETSKLSMQFAINILNKMCDEINYTPAWNKLDEQRRELENEIKKL